MESIKKWIAKTTKWQRIIAVAIVSIILVLLVSFSVYKSNTGPVSSKSSEIVFEVIAGDNVDSLCARLEQKGIIKNATFAKWDAKFSGLSALVAGQYRVDKSWGSTRILTYFTKQSNVLRDEVMITFREGIWAKDVAALLEEKLGIPHEELISLWNDDNFLKTCIDKYDFLDDSILNSEYRIKLEGYLFPETYSFQKNATKEEITFTFLKHFDTQYKKIKEKANEKKMSVHDIVTLASVVQYESKSKEDMNMVAGVFDNRLNIDMPLQSSVTVCYAMYEFDSWEECETNVDIDSLYNTYLYGGLPVGPILNPGSEAIDAVLNPAKHDFLYFISDINNVRNEGAGKVYYSKTMDAHLKLQKDLGLMW